VHAVSFKNDSRISQLIDLNELLVFAEMHLNTEEVFEFFKVRHFLLSLQSCLDAIDATQKLKKMVAFWEFVA